MKTNTTFSISSIIEYYIFGGIVGVETFISNEDAVTVFIGKVSDLAKGHGHDAIDTIEGAYEWLGENEESLEVSYSLQVSLLNNKEGLQIEDYEMLASENKFMGEFLSKLGYSQDEVSEIANSGLASISPCSNPDNNINVNPVFAIGETFTLPYIEYDAENKIIGETIETYTITGYDLSDGIIYLGDYGSAWISENDLIEQKAKFKVGDTFTIHFEYYAPGEVTTHTITKIDFSKQEFDDVVYWAEGESMGITESEIIKQRKEQ